MYSSEKKMVETDLCDKLQVANDGGLGAAESQIKFECKVKRKLSFGTEDEIHMRHHQLLLCKSDLSPFISLRDYCVREKKRLATSVPTPGGLRDRFSRTTADEVKLVVKEIYVLVKTLNKAGYSVAGKYLIDHFVLDKHKGKVNVRFASLKHDQLLESTPELEKLDEMQFEKMVRREVFTESIVPHDLNYWLSQLGKSEFESLMPYHICLMEEQEAADKFMTWHDIFDDLEKRGKKSVKEDIIRDLKLYDNWYNILLQDQYVNSYVEETLLHFDPLIGGQVNYPLDISVLLQLLRDCRQRHAKACQEHFLLIVGHHFPNLMAHFQQALFKAGCLKVKGS